MADHRHDLALSLERLDLVGLLVRQDFGQNVLDACVVRDRLGRRRVVAGEHPGLEPEGFQLLHRNLRGAQGVCDGDQAGRFMPNRNVHRRGAGAREGCRVL